MSEDNLEFRVELAQTLESLRGQVKALSDDLNRYQTTSERNDEQFRTEMRRQRKEIRDMWGKIRPFAEREELRNEIRKRVLVTLTSKGVWATLGVVVLGIGYAMVRWFDGG